MLLIGAVDFCDEVVRQLEVECRRDDAVLNNGEVDEICIHS